MKQLVHDYRVVRKELEKYGHGLSEKKEIVAVNKMELVEEKDRAKIGEQFEKKTGKKIVWVSAGMGDCEGLIKVLS